MGDLICSDGLSLSDFSARLEMLMLLDSPILSAGAVGGLGVMYPLQTSDFSSLFNAFPPFFCFPGLVIVIMSTETSPVTPSV